MNQYLNGSSRNLIRFLLFLFLAGFCNISVEGQKVVMIQIKGTIVNERGDPIEGARIYASEGAVIINTDEKGMFNAEVNRIDRLLIEADDHQSLQLDAVQLIQGENIVLISTPFQMGEDDAVNVPFGVLKKRQIAGAVSEINPEEILKYDARQSVYAALNSRVPGLFGNLNNRGIGQALVVVDGIPRPANNFNLQEVDQITYLRDATSRMLYGSQADNGVIMITTKRGQAYKRKISVSAEYGLNDPISYPKFLGSYDYARLYNEAAMNDGLSPVYDSAALAGYRTGSNPVLYPDQEYYNSEFLKNYQPFASVITEFSGGSELAQYYMNIGWNTSGTLLKVGEGANERSHRLNIRGNVDFKITDYIKMNLDIVGILDFGQNPRGNYWGNSSNFHPNYYPMLIDTNDIQITGNEGVLKIVDGNKILGGTSQYQTNIYGDLVLGGYQKTMNRTGQLNTGLDFDLKGITEGLTAKLYLSFDIYNFFRTQQANTYAVYEPQLNANDTITVVKIGSDNFSGSQGIGGVTFQRYVGYYGTLDYKRVFGDHRVDATGLAYSDQTTYDNQIHQDVHLNFGLRANYMYKNKLLAEFSAAVPGSPKFESGRQYAFSPSIGLGWIITEEDFISENSALNYMKLKGSYGILNTDRSIGDYYLYNNNFVQGGSFEYSDGNQYNNLLLIENVGNPEISYVKRKELSVGFEASLFENTLWLEANYFSSVSDNTITRRSNAYPAYLGGFYPYENYGSISDQGVEVGLDYRKNWDDFSLDLGTFFVYSVPEVLARDEPDYEYDYRQRVGKPSDAIFGWVADGMFADSADIADHETQTFGAVQPGDIKYKDLNEDGKIDENDQKMIGNSSARMQIGLNLKLRYKNLEIYAQGVYQSGADQIYSSAYYWQYGDRKYSEYALNRWTQETASTASYPRLSTKNNSNNFRNSTFWMYDDSYFTLRTIQLTYTFPEKWMQSMPTQSIMLYVRGNNLVTASPSKKQQQLNVGSTPQFRAYAIGLKMMF